MLPCSTAVLSESTEHLHWVPIADHSVFNGLASREACAAAADVQEPKNTKYQMPRTIGNREHISAAAVAAAARMMRSRKKQSGNLFSIDISHACTPPNTQAPTHIRLKK